MMNWTEGKEVDGLVFGETSPLRNLSFWEDSGDLV
jgi:hypothetical protein